MTIRTRSRANLPPTPKRTGSKKTEGKAKTKAEGTRTRVEGTRTRVEGTRTRVEGAKTKTSQSLPKETTTKRSRSTETKGAKSSSLRSVDEEGESPIHGTRKAAALLNYTEEEDEAELYSDYSEEEEKDFLSLLKGTSNLKKKRTKAGIERRSRGINEKDRRLIRQMIREDHEPAVIVSAASFHPGKRRIRIPWTPAEIRNLRLGVERFGLAWSNILKCREYKFHSHRKQMDLKDKWRNLTAYRPYGSHGKRTFIILDSNHQPISRPGTDRPYKFVNRWPRDAALKAASRTEFYEAGRTTTTIYVREVDPENSQSSAIPPIVHVYEGARVRVHAPKHLNEVKVRHVWSSDVRKIREERFVSKEDLTKIERAAGKL